MKVNQYSRKKSAFTMIELLTTILVVAAMITVGLIYIGGYINDAKTQADKKNAYGFE